MTDDLPAGERLPDVVERWPAVPLSVYRQAYTVAGVPWPGDAEVRRRHRVDDAGAEQVSATARQSGWRRVAELGPEQRREARARSAAARAAVRCYYRPGSDEFGRGWDAALCAVYELVGDVQGLRVLLCGLLGATSGKGASGSESDGGGSGRPG